MTDRGGRPPVAPPEPEAARGAGPGAGDGGALVRIRASWPAWLLGLTWVACAVAINPAGDFPLNDDWAFGLPVKPLLDEHALKLTDWQEPALVAQLLWGALFCLPGGFSFTALRASTLTLGLVGVVGLYGLLRHLGADRKVAWVGAALLGFNPFYLNLAFSFMTDVPFLGLMIASSLLLLRGLDRDRTGEVVAGLILATAAMFVRQLGLMVLLGFAAAYPLRRGFGRRWFFLAVAPAAGAVVLLALYGRYLEAIGQVPGVYHGSTDGIRRTLADLAHLRVGALRPILRTFLVSAMYLGLWCLPLTLLVLPGALRGLDPRWRRPALAVAGVLAAGGTLLLARAGWLMPMTPNLWNDFNVGIPSLARSAGDPAAPRAAWVAVTAAAALGAALAGLALGLLAHDLGRGLLRRCAGTGEPGRAWRVAFLAAVGVLCFAPVALNYKPPFDRYFLAFLPPVAGLLVAAAPAGWRPIGARAFAVPALLLAAWGAYGVGAAHDYLAWNRVRWAAAGDLRGRLGLAASEVDGGFEYNNYHRTLERFREGLVHRQGDGGLVDASGRRARLAWDPLPGHDVIDVRDCPRWLPWGHERIYLLKAREAPSAGRADAPAGAIAGRD